MSNTVLNSLITHIATGLSDMGIGASMPEERLNEYRRHFQEAKAARAKLRRPLDPPPRFDRVYQEALARMNEGERYEIPPGDVVISEDAKERIRRQGEG